MDLFLLSRVDLIAGKGEVEMIEKNSFFLSWQFVGLLVLLNLVLFTGIVYSFEIITFSNASQEFISSEGNCELVFNRTPEWDINYTGYWDCQELQEKASP